MNTNPIVQPARRRCRKCNRVLSAGCYGGICPHVAACAQRAAARAALVVQPVAVDHSNRDSDCNLPPCACRECLQLRAAAADRTIGGAR